MNIEPPDPSFLLNSYLCIQREIFVNVCAHFLQNVESKNSSLCKRAIEFSIDFNHCEAFKFEKLMLNEKNFPIFCNYMFDFMNYVRKIDSNLYEESIGYARNQMSFPTMPTLDMSVIGCGQSISTYLDMKERGELPKMEDFEDGEQN